MNQFEPMTMFDYLYPRFEITKPIRLIELFAGVGSQAMALRDIGVNFEHHKVVEFDKYAVDSYNAIHGTDFPIMDVTKVKGEDLEIADIDEYCYILTYSFPCQDLSIAGKGKGMTKGDNTRSGLLWEVERLLNETKHLPQVLLMENVPEVAGEKNLKDFQDWQLFLEGKGYSNYAEILNAKHFGVAQNRERCFMVSILGEWNYKFPQPNPLTKTMKDYLEDEVEEKYYINNEKAQNLINQLTETGQLQGNTNCTDGTINEPKVKDVSNCIKARYDAGISNLRSDGTMVVEKPIDLKVIGQMDHTIDRTFESANRVYDSKGISPTVNTCGGGGLQPKVIVASRGRNPNNPSDRTPGSPTEQRLEPNKEGLCNTITSVQKDNLLLIGKIADYNQRSEVWDSEGIAVTQTANSGGVGGSTGAYLVKDTVPYRIRKLTPKECWRLMGFTDLDFFSAMLQDKSKAKELLEKYKGNTNGIEIMNEVESMQKTSNSQLYKQAGNSIVKAVLEGIFKGLMSRKEGCNAKRRSQS